MRKEERQDFIDKILQLSKYKSVFENLKPLIDNYLAKHELISQLSEFIISEKQSIQSIEKSIQELDEKIIDNGKKLSVITPSIEKKSNEMKSINEKLKTLRQKNEQILIQKQRSEHLKKSIEKTVSEQKELIEKNDALKPKLLSNSESIDSLNEKLSNESSKLKVLDYQVLKLKKDNEEILKLQANCPTCRQKIPDEHKKALGEKNNDEILGLEKSKKEIIGIINKLNESLMIAKKNDELKKEISTFDSAISLLERQISSQKKELSSLKEERNELLQEEISKLEEDYGLISAKFNELSNKKAGINSANQELKNQLPKLTAELSQWNLKRSQKKKIM
jgi:chromosome segregation ATPase